MHDKEIEDIINKEVMEKYSNNNEMVNSISKNLANLACKNSQNK